MATKTFGLGKGLGSLIPGQYNKTENFSEPSSIKSEKIQEISLEKISANPMQPRQEFEQKHLEALRDSIKTFGILEPLVVSPMPDNKFQLIAGERRLRAAKLAGLKTVPVIIREAKEQEKLEMALIENLLRQDLNILEEAAAYQKLADEFNLTHEEIAKKVGKSRPVISNTLRLLKLPEYILEAISSGKISSSHAKIMAGLEGPELDKFYNQVINQKLTVAESEKAVRQVAVQKHFRSTEIDPQVKAWQEELRQVYNTKVEIKKDKKTGAGRIIIEYFSPEELNRILEEMKHFRV